ncbi:MAG: dihydroorotase family protein [Candidatus Thermoplasmatota archaeon]
MDFTVEGKIFVDGTFQKACVAVENGRITAVKKNLHSDQHYDFGKKLILPAGVDLHVHFRDPGYTYKEDFSTGSLAALHGGVSCVFDMPNTNPQTNSVRETKNKMDMADKKSFVDFGVHAGITHNNFGDLEEISKFCNGFKVYLGSSTNSLLLDEDNLEDLFENLQEIDVPVLFHAESEQCLKENRLDEEKNLYDHLRSRPSGCETNSLKKVFSAAQHFKKHIHICHVSSYDALKLIDHFRRNHGFVSAGVTPHHCLLCVDEKYTPQSFFKTNPPVRESFDMKQLFKAVKQGSVELLESDHAPHTLNEKQQSFDDAPSGLPGVETLYPIFLYLAKKESISWKQLFNLFCEKPAEIMDVSKGCIKEGFDADFIVVDLNKEKKVEAKNLHSKCDWTPFEEWKGIFPSDVFIRGKRVIEEGDVVVDAGFGRAVKNV